MRVPAVPVAPRDLQCDDMPGDAQSALETVPGGSCRDAFPGGALGIDELGERVVQVVRHGDREQACRVAAGLPRCQCSA